MTSLIRIIIPMIDSYHAHTDITLFIHMSTNIISALTLAMRLSYVRTYMYLLRFVGSSMQNASEHCINANTFVKKLRGRQPGMHVCLTWWTTSIRSDIIDSRLNKPIYTVYSPQFTFRWNYLCSITLINLVKIFCDNKKRNLFLPKNKLLLSINLLYYYYY